MKNNLIALAVLLAAGIAARPVEDDRGRPVILLVHGRAMLDRDTAGLRQLWYRGLTSGVATLTHAPLVAERDVRLVWYADVLDPQSDERCDFQPADPRLRRATSNDAELRTFLSGLGSVVNVLSGFLEQGKGGQLRALAGDLSYMADTQKRCAAESRLAAALARARREGRPVILVAHSFGSLVAYDQLSAVTPADSSPMIERFITVGAMVGAPELRRLMLGDSSEVMGVPPRVRSWVNIRNPADAFATPVATDSVSRIVQDLTTAADATEPDAHEMVGYLRNPVTARAILEAWCGAFVKGKPEACAAVAP